MEFVEPIRDKKTIDLVKNILKKRKTRDYLLFLIGINSGLRISDILNLKVKDVWNRSYIEIKEKKTGKLKRFPITKSFKTELYEFLIGKDAEEWLFSSRKGNKAITRTQAYRIIHRACFQAGIKYRTGTHTLRKTFGYHFYQEYKDIALLQNILNHCTPSVTLRYIGINQDLIDSSLYSFNL